MFVDHKKNIHQFYADTGYRLKTDQDWCPIGTDGKKESSESVLLVGLDDDDDDDDDDRESCW